MDLHNVLVATTSEVFATMLMLEVTPTALEQSAATPFVANISGMLGFSGDVSGVISLHCPEAVATSITSSFLGMEVSEIDDDVKDAIGELVNMITGGLKDAMATEGRDLKLAIPTTVSGRSFRISHQGAEGRVVVPFAIDQGTFLVELKYQFNAG